MVWMISRAHTLTEAAGAASLAAAYRLRKELKGKKVGIICSGGNTTLEHLKKAIESAPEV
jgi:threonine dehydratase